jgi:hypothetical protein
MPFSITNTIKKPNATPDWSLKYPRDKGDFTDEEYNNIIVPYWDWIESQMGFISCEMSFPDEFTKVTTITCEHEEEARHIFAATTKNGDIEPHETAKAFMDLIASNRPSTVIVEPH